MILFSLVPLITFLLLISILCFKWKERAGYLTIFRTAVVVSTLVTSLFIVVTTELLSAFELISFPYILGVWVVFLFALIAYAFFQRMPMAVILQVFTGPFNYVRRNPLIAIVTALILISLAVALVYPPNNYDSMTYHMARVAHWEQNQSVDHYRTHIPRQLVYQPFAEWVILHLQILTGGDKLANSVQLFFLAASLIALSLIVKLFGGSRKQQEIVIALACTIPMAIIQSNTTQNDIVVAFFIVCFALITVRAVQQFRLVYIVAAGVTLGLAWLTKGTAYLFTALFCAWYILALLNIRHWPLRKILQRALMYAIIPVIAVFLNYGHYSRNLFFNDSVLGKASEGTANEGFDLKALGLVAIKNIFNHLPVTREIKVGLKEKAIAMNVEPDDPRYSFNSTDWMAEGFSFHEDYAQNVFHTILILLFVFIFLVRPTLYSKPPDRYLLFVLTLVATAAVFTIMLKWQPWSNRLQIALFMLFSVFLAMEIGRLRSWLRYIILVPVMAYGCIALAKNARHPILPISQSILKLPRSDFAYHTELLPLREYLKDKPIKTFGIDIGSDHLDYPLFTLLKTGDHKDRIVKHVRVLNESTMYLDNFVPDAILTSQGGFDKITIQTKTYFKTGSYGWIHLYEPKP